MHLALPKKRITTIPTYSTRHSRNSNFRRNRIKSLAFCVCLVGALIFIFSQLIGSSKRALYGRSSVVIVTVLDHINYNKEYIENIKKNRINYANKHGYATFFPNISDYELNGAPSSWARVPAVRHALAKYDKLDEDIMSPKKLEKLMLRNQPIVPPNSVIKTFPNLKTVNVELVLTQDKDGLAPSSFILRRGDWSNFFLDTWFDPLYRSYNFQKGETHALEHIVQWHPTILSKLALVPQKVMNSYKDSKFATESGTYVEGDFIIDLYGCEKNDTDCAADARPYLEKTESNR